MYLKCQLNYQLHINLVRFGLVISFYDSIFMTRLKREFNGWNVRRRHWGLLVGSALGMGIIWKSEYE